MEPHLVLPNVRFRGKTIFTVTLKSPIFQSNSLFTKFTQIFRFQSKNSLEICDYTRRTCHWVRTVFGAPFPLRHKRSNVLRVGPGLIQPGEMATVLKAHEFRGHHSGMNAFSNIHPTKGVVFPPQP